MTMTIPGKVQYAELRGNLHLDIRMCALSSVTNFPQARRDRLPAEKRETSRHAREREERGNAARSRSRDYLFHVNSICEFDWRTADRKTRTDNVIRVVARTKLGRSVGAVRRRN